MRFGIFQIRKFKEGKTKIRKKLSEQIGFLFAIILIIGGLAVMRFGIFQIRKFKKGKIEVKKKISDKIAFVIFFAVIIGLIVYSVNDLLFS